MLVLVLVLVLKDSFRTYFKSLSLSWSLGVRSLSLSLGGQVQEGLVLVLGGQVLVLILVLGSQVLVLVLVLGGQVLVNIPGKIWPRGFMICGFALNLIVLSYNFRFLCFFWGEIVPCRSKTLRLSHYCSPRPRHNQVDRLAGA